MNKKYIRLLLRKHSITSWGMKSIELMNKSELLAIYENHILKLNETPIWRTPELFAEMYAYLHNNYIVV